MTAHRLANDPQMPPIGSVVGERYAVESVLGEGGFAVVYRAFDTRTKASVAIKVLDPIMSRRDEFSTRFVREVETVSRLQHPNTIRLFDAGQTDRGCLFLVMELLEGQPLDVLLEREGALAPERVRHIAVQVLKSLQEAHAKGIIHRDLKPANVFLAELAGEHDFVKVLDFGIAKSVDESANTHLTATGQVVCSPHYVAPERVKDHHTVPASDLYSLGIMMVELLEGTPPYQAESTMMLAVRHMSPEPVPLREATRALPFGHVVERACAKSLADRYASAAEMLADLGAANGTTLRVAAMGGATVAQPMPRAVAAPTQGIDADPPAARSRLPLVVGAAAIALLGAGAAVYKMATHGDETASAPTVETATAAAPAATATAEAGAGGAVAPSELALAPPAEAAAVAEPVAPSAELTAAMGAAQTSLYAATSAAFNAAAAQAAALVPAAAPPQPGRRTDERRRSPERETAAAPVEAAAPAAAPAEPAPAAPPAEGGTPARRIRTDVAPRR